MATLRFNFRGVGESEGDYSGSFGEADDARAAASHLLRETRLDSVTLAGYSFGAMVALLAGHDHPAVSHQVAIGLPVTMFDTGFLAGCSKPSLFVLGDRDPYCPYDALERLVDSLPAPKRLVRVPGGDHFLVGFEDRVAEAVESFLCD
jgi:hypothetical protein